MSKKGEKYIDHNVPQVKEGFILEDVTTLPASIIEENEEDSHILLF